MSRPVLPESAYEALGLSPETVKFLMTPLPEPTKIAAPNILESDPFSDGRLAPNETSIILYAELLLHIRTVTFFASLRTNHNRETTAKLSSDGSCITVSHEGQIASIRLPINVKGGGDVALSLPSQPTGKEITLRLQMEEREGSDLLGTLQSEERTVNVMPWDGMSLSQTQDIEVMCKSCRTVVVPRGRIKHWRDLPNENWAEMMDFWHCHKPDEHHLHDHTNEEAVAHKGYAAGNRLQVSEGKGFVDLTSFLLKEQDCEGAQVSPKEDSKPARVVCRQCSTAIGSQDEASGGLRLWKWNLGIAPASSPQLPVTHPTQKWISARLLYLIDNFGVRKFHIHPPLPLKTAIAIPDTESTTKPPSSNPSLLIWVFTPDLLVSSSLPSATRQDPTRSIKIFYKRQTWKPLEPGDAESATIEEVEFPAELYEELHKGLEESQKLLPSMARTFQGWEVGLLDRFDVFDVQSRSNEVDKEERREEENTKEEEKEEVNTKEEEELEQEDVD